MQKYYVINRSNLYRGVYHKGSYFTFVVSGAQAYPQASCIVQDYCKAMCDKCVCTCMYDDHITVLTSFERCG